MRSLSWNKERRGLKSWGDLLLMKNDSEQSCFAKIMHITHHSFKKSLFFPRRFWRQGWDMSPKLGAHKALYLELSGTSL